jgi:hypothetical protein
MWETPYWLALILWGGLVGVGSLALLAVVIFAPSSPHSGHTGKVFLFTIAGWGIAYGVSQIRKALREKHSTAKETGSE